MKAKYIDIFDQLIKSGISANSAKRHLLRITNTIEHPTVKFNYLLKKYGIPYADINPEKHSFGDFLKYVQNISVTDMCTVFGQPAGETCIMLSVELQEAHMIEFADSD